MSREKHVIFPSHVDESSSGSCYYGQQSQRESSSAHGSPTWLHMKMLIALGIFVAMCHIILMFLQLRETCLYA